jgi:hypothetical protein
MSALDTQVGGNHYREGGIQPVQYIEANGLGFLEGCAVKRLTRHNRPTGKGRQDIEKAIHELQLLLELRYPLAAVEFGQQHSYRFPKGEPEGPDVSFEGEHRMEPIGQNGNTGEHYEELAELAIRAGNSMVALCGSCTAEHCACTAR